VGGGGGDRFSLTVPARAGLVGTIRVFASAVARHYGLAEQIVEDVKLAVSEACTDPIDAGAGGDITVVLLDDGPDLRCEIASSRWDGNGAGASDLPEGIDPAVLDRLQLVRALFSDAERSGDGAAVTVRFSTASRTAEMR
jgi:Histidine kinase-like ATPase domain